MALKHVIIGRKHGQKDFDPKPIKFGLPNDLRAVIKKYQQPPQEDPDYGEVQLAYLVKLKTVRLSKPDTGKKPAPEPKPEPKHEASKPIVHTAPIHRPSPPTHRTPVK